jgi:hypothetical protein
VAGILCEKADEVEDLGLYGDRGISAASSPSTT